MKLLATRKASLPTLFAFALVAHSGWSLEALAANKTDYDGKWIAEINCARNVVNDAEKFSFKIRLNVKNGSVDAKRSVKDQNEVTNETWSGTLTSDSVRISAAATRGKAHWNYSFNGKMLDRGWSSTRGSL